jgi:Na+/H+ antiporter NhaC
MSEHPYGLLSLLPPLVAIVLAVATRRVILSLLLGVFVGALLLECGRSDLPATASLVDRMWPNLPDDSPIRATVDRATFIVGRSDEAVTATLEKHLWPSLTDESHLRVFAFTLMMGALVGVVQRSGGMVALVQALSPLARSRRSGQLTTWLLGLVIFFDDYANTLLLGGTMRSLADRLRISREKLAYLVDSTAAPVAGLAIVSTWVAGEIGFIQEGFAELDMQGAAVDGFAVFIATIPYRFYVVWALALVPLIALSGRDFGPMLAAEQRANCDPQLGRELVANRPSESECFHAASWYDALLPIVSLIGVTGWLLVATGTASLAEQGVTNATWMQRFGSGDSYLSLVYGSLAGLLTAMLWTRLRGHLTWHQVRQAAFEGASQMLAALTILWLAWALSSLTSEEQLGTAGYLGSVLRQTITPLWLPTVIFVLSSLIAFATGTSWGTMAIVMPLAVRVACQVMSVQVTSDVAGEPILMGAVGSVLAGAIFGDHCSPISDTTVLSSQASGCDHVGHVRTQLPYALLVGMVSILCGTLPIGMGVSVWLLLPLGVVVLMGSVFLIGRRVA